MQLRQNCSGPDRFHFFLPSVPFLGNQGIASAEERQESYFREKESWIEKRAMRIVKRDAIPQGSIFIGSQIVFRYKNNGIVKARIVPLGHRDPIKCELRGDAPCIQPESLRLLMSIAATKGWSTREMDVSGAYFTERWMEAHSLHHISEGRWDRGRSVVTHKTRLWSGQKWTPLVSDL